MKNKTKNSIRRVRENEYIGSLNLGGSIVTFKFNHNVSEQTSKEMEEDEEIHLNEKSIRKNFPITIRNSRREKVDTTFEEYKRLLLIILDLVGNLEAERCAHVQARTIPRQPVI
ncbi:MAG: hypothetical protein JWO00_52 [Candidatus Parcubacteria bacterium]|nr:hypothetical protein [Candidatus Parcubacteria bacterium]